MNNPTYYQTNPTLRFIPRPGSPIFTHEGKEYYLVTFEALPGITQSTHRDALNALRCGGHVPAKVRNDGIFDRKEFRTFVGWITLFDYRDDMNGNVYFRVQERGAPYVLSYPLSHMSGPTEHPALCYRPLR